jgi:hypothetical protein
MHNERKDTPFPNNKMLFLHENIEIMNRILILFLLFGISGLFSHCTIQKRTFRPGYHVEWKQRNTFSADQTAPVSSEINSKTEEIPSQTDTNAVLAENSLRNENMDKLPTENFKVENKQLSTTFHPEKNLADTIYVTPKTDPAGIASVAGLGLGVSSIVLSSISIGISLFGVALLLLLVSMILGYISIHRVRKAPYLYTNTWLGYLGAFGSTALLLFGLLLIILIIVAFTF